MLGTEQNETQHRVRDAACCDAISGGISVPFGPSPNNTARVPRKYPRRALQPSISRKYIPLCKYIYIYIYMCAYGYVHLYLHIHIFSLEHQKQDGMRGHLDNLGFGIIKGSATTKAMMSCVGPRFMGPLRAPIFVFAHTHTYIYIYGYIPVSALLVLEVKYTCISLRFPLYLYYMCLYLFIYM